MFSRRDADDVAKLAVLAASAAEAQELLVREPMLSIGSRREAERRLRLFEETAQRLGR